MSWLILNVPNVFAFSIIFSKMRPFNRTQKKNTRIPQRRITSFKRKKAVARRENLGVIGNKGKLKTCFLNVDGLNDVTFEDIKNTVDLKKPDMVFLVETKRRCESTNNDINIPDYTLHEACRSDIANDKDGGGIAVFTKVSDGIVFKRYTPDIPDPHAAFVANERVWITVESQACKTAVCGLYMGCQFGDDRNCDWNNTIYQTLQHESFALRSKGYRVVFLGDFNGHVGDNIGEGVPGNTPSINPNGRRFLDFLQHTHTVHINGSVRIPGRWDTRRTSGLWTRQRGGHSSIIDYGVISAEHVDTVIDMKIDDIGQFGTNSDHNWLFLNLSDRFVTQRRVTNINVKKSHWNIHDNQDWSGYQDQVCNSLNSVNVSSPESLASSISAVILSALHTHIGLKSTGVRRPKLLPPGLVEEFKKLRSLERKWKSLNVASANRNSEEVSKAESDFLEQKGRTHELFYLHRLSKRPSILHQCSGDSSRALKNFWSHVSPKKKQNSEISATINPTSGTVHCNLDAIRTDTEEHLLALYQGSLEKTPRSTPISNTDHTYPSRRPAKHHGVPQDHVYSVKPTQQLPHLNDSQQIDPDPAGWLNSDFSVSEIKKAVKNLQNGKAKGWDMIPNEALKNLPDDMLSMVALLFNKIKSSGSLPTGWNRGRITLIHKYGLRELLGNYRPITVIISLSGLYSKVLNERLTQVVEKHNLLGEIQNGFRKNRGGPDNSFILNTILWKAKSKKEKAHLAFLDISKAYDSVNREVLWQRLSSIGIKGDFLSSLKALYTGDCIDCMVNGLLTRPIFLRRGLRQGCSLSPMLFALYISGVGADITSSSVGFTIGNVTVSGLLFADDIVLVSKSAEGLKSLLGVVKSGFDSLKLLISYDKSQIVSPDDIEWNLPHNSSQEARPLKQVALYKYLGNWTYNSMYKTGVEKQKLCVKTAFKYKCCCMHVSRLGPDIVDVVTCTWMNVAIPAILNGCDIIPFSETNILEVERIQSQIAKFALGLPISAPNYCAQTELGWKTFRQQLYEKQLKFYFRVLYLDEGRWAHQALLDHLSGSWASPYMVNICAIRSRLGIFSAPTLPMVWKNCSQEHFLASSNKLLSHNHVMKPMKGLARMPYVCESKWATIIAQFRLGCEGLGAKQPLRGLSRRPFCPVCPDQHRNTGVHLLFECSSLAALRAETGISSFRNSCIIKGLTIEQAYSLFINGLDLSHKNICRNDHHERGKCIDKMRSLWLTKW